MSAKDLGRKAENPPEDCIRTFIMGGATGSRLSRSGPQNRIVSR